MIRNWIAVLTQGTDASAGSTLIPFVIMYGVIIDMVEDQDIIIVEFGNNKNCRIPMKKAAVIEVEKADAK